MLEYLTKLGINKNLKVQHSSEYVKNKVEDFDNLPLQLYLKKYYARLDDYSNEVWGKVRQNLIEPSYDESRYQEMANVFGYKSKINHDFNKQYQFYNDLKKDTRLDKDTQMFIGFMAGNHFFDEHIRCIDEWFNSYYWTRPDLMNQYPEYKLNHNINDVLNSAFGLNYFKSVLLTLNWWNRI